MPQVIADLLQRESRAYKMTCTGVTQAVRAAVQCRNAQFGEASANDVIERTWRERAEGGVHGEEDLASFAPGPSLTEIPQNRSTHFIHERVLLSAALLRTSNGDDLFFPVDVLQAQPGDFPAAECVNRKQHQDGAISNSAWRVRVGAGNQTLHILP